MATINAIGTPEITLGGTFTMSGAYSFIGQLVGNTNVTFPTSGTLATTGGTVQSIQGTANQVLVNGTSGSPVTGTAIILTTPQDIATTSSPTFLALTAGNLNLSGSTLSSVSTNSNLDIVPNGTGKVCLLQADGLPGSSAVFQVIKDGISVGSVLGSCINTSAAANINFWKTRGTTVSTFTAVQSGDDLGSQNYYGTDGTDGFIAAQVYARVDGSVSAGIVPGRFQWYTANSSGVSSLAMTLDSSQNLTLSGNQIKDVNSNNIITLLAAGSAVNNIQIANNTTGNSPSVRAIGSDTDVALTLRSQGAGLISLVTQATTQPILIYSGTSSQHLSRFIMANTAADRSYTWPDASGTIALGGSTIPSITGTANQVLVNGTSGTPVTGTAITLTTPQDIATTSNVTFNSVIAGNLNLAGSTLSSIATDSNISIFPSGTGVNLFGTTTAFANKNGGFIQAAVIGGNAGISTASYGAGFYGTFNAYHSRSNTIGSFVAVQAGDTLAQFTALGDDGTQFSTAGSMQFVAQGTISNGVVPGNWLLYTANSSGVNTLAMTMNSSQQLILANALTVPYGGTGIGTATAYGLITGGTTATGAFQSVATGTAGQMLQSGGPSALPTWTTATFPAAAGATGTILRSNGTGWVATTSTFADTYAASALLYSNGANTVTGLATTNSAALVTNGSGVPAWQAMLAGQILVGTTSGAPVATAINSGTNITVANGSGTITVNLSGVVAPTLGGTGVNNGSNTLTLAGNLATSGAFASTFTMTGATNVTFPTSGTLATTATASGIVNSGLINQLAWYAASGTTVSGLATANNGILVTSASGVPSISNTIGGSITVNGDIIGQFGNNIICRAPTVGLGGLAMGAVNTAGNFFGIMQNSASLTANRTYTFPDTTGTVALTSDITTALGNYSFSANTMTVASGNMLFTPPGGTLGIQSSTDTNFNVVSTSATGMPYLQWTRNTSTAIAYIQAGTNVSGNASSSGMLFVNNIAAGHYFFNISGTGNVLDLGPTTATFVGAITSPSIAFSSTSGIIGTTTNDSAAAGSVGELISSVRPSASALALTTGTIADMTTISLTAGDWDVWGNVSFVPNGGVTIMVFDRCWISSTSATAPDASLYMANYFSPSFAPGISIGLTPPSIRVSVNTTTTIYLSCDASFSVSTLAACGGLYARRRR